MAAADGHLKTLNMAMMPLERALFDQTLAQTRSMLDGASFERAWAEGQKMTIEQALDYAHEELVSREETP